MSEARARILARLKAAQTSRARPPRPSWSPPAIPPEERLGRFTAMLEAVHGEVHEVAADQWPDRLAAILAHRGINRILYAPETGRGHELALAWAGREGAPELIAYDRDVEDMKNTLVDGVDAGLTTTMGAIAETGTLVLIPTAAEPRLISLLPPVHIALVEADEITDTLAALVAKSGLAGAMPTNLLLISGPSKTADIEQTLAYGVHGPKELIVLVLGK